MVDQNEFIDIVPRCLLDNFPCRWKGDCDCKNCVAERGRMEKKIEGVQYERLKQQVRERTYSE